MLAIYGLFPLIRESMVVSKLSARFGSLRLFTRPSAIWSMEKWEG
ncbi:hypothetical protein HALLA_20330 (plasmid) [Halostagnicola larsenii XH-48]|uniref:Uncharacterized protein n=1 Tax=Halostagnicola larsenii XH-48 TaxID=797299 RepID=W0JUJ3_9EURY|nr:hypothetical protein HALLA_20330 [Halostagnicola larsenii XH-48]